MELYTPREASEILTALTGKKIGNKSYYYILRMFGIINNNNILLSPYIETGDWCYAEEQYIQPRQRLVAIHRKVLTTRKGIDRVLELLNEYWAKNN